MHPVPGTLNREASCTRNLAGATLLGAIIARALVAHAAPQIHEIASQSAPSIMGATDSRSASVAAFKGIQRPPRLRRLSRRARRAHNTHRMRGAPPYPAQRQAEGGVWVAQARRSSITESKLSTLPQASVDQACRASRACATWCNRVGHGLPRCLKSAELDRVPEPSGAAWSSSVG